MSLVGGRDPQSVGEGEGHMVQVTCGPSSVRFLPRAEILQGAED